VHDGVTIATGAPPASIFARCAALFYQGAGLVSTAADYSRIDEMLLNGGSYRRFSVGAYGWDGAFDTVAFVNLSKRFYAILMTQMPLGAYSFSRDFVTATYSDRQP
jgi:CubicO group peptidase (beta-lactamase class C family)